MADNDAARIGLVPDGFDRSSSLSGERQRIMCGIVGAVWNDARAALSPETLRRMTASLASRGPDDEGFWQSREGLPGCALGHRRLAIIDPQGNRQPMTDADQNAVIVFNGAIYNYRELRDRLSAAGIELRTSGDTEVILGLYRVEGAAMLAQLRGMFAFALWDIPRRRLLLARDRYGKKPLVYCLSNGSLIFASTLTALLVHPEAPRAIDRYALDQYLALQYVPHPQTIIEKAYKLPPGCYATFSAGRLTIARFTQPLPFGTWDWMHPEEGGNRATPSGPANNVLAAKVAAEAATEIDEIAAARDNAGLPPTVPSWPLDCLPTEEISVRPAETLRAALTRAVELRLRSDVPVGVFLSGGIDSSIIAGLMHQLGVSPLRSYSIGFDDPRYDESRYAELVARRFRTEHHLLRLDARIADDLPEIVAACDEPMADSSLAAAWHLAKMAGRDVRVALSGEGGDELFFGYPRYTAVWLAEQIVGRVPWLQNVFTALSRWGLPGAMGQRGLIRRFRRFVAGLPLPAADRYARWMEVFSTEQRTALYSHAFSEPPAVGPSPKGFLGFDASLGGVSASMASIPSSRGQRGSDWLSSLWLASDAATASSACGSAGCSTESPAAAAVRRAAWVDLASYLPCDLMTKTDRATMAHAIECRCPWLDPVVAAVAWHLPTRLMFRWGRGKRIVREAFSDLLPPAVARRRKMGFGVPIAAWMRGPWRGMLYDVLLGSSATTRELFDPVAVRRLCDEHMGGTADHSHRLWTLLVLELWGRNNVPHGLR